MPELPEVETIRRDLEQHLPHKKISAIQIIDGRILRQSSKNFIQRLTGVVILSVNRRGKALYMPLSSGEYLVVQVMMTGQLIYEGKEKAHERLAFEFSDHTFLRYHDQRVFGQVRVVKRLDEIGYFKVIGPEPFDEDFSARYIADALKISRRPIKNVLLDHRFVAGIGNIYACEILYQLKLNPATRACEVKKTKLPLLQRITRDVLREAIKNRGTSMRNYRDASGKQGEHKSAIQVYGRAQEPCMKCRGPIQRIVQAGRSTFFCGRCQK